MSLGDSAADASWLVPDLDEGIVGWLALVLGAVVVVVVVIPLLLFGVELIILGIALALAILGRALLGRPWLVRATPIDDHQAVVGWRVVGWRRSGRVIEEVAAALAAGAQPRPAERVEEVVGTAVASGEQPSQERD